MPQHLKVLCAASISHNGTPLVRFAAVNTLFGQVSPATSVSTLGQQCSVHLPSFSYSGSLGPALAFVHLILPFLSPALRYVVPTARPAV